MFTQKRQAASQRKLHSIFVTPAERSLSGMIEIGKSRYGFDFSPQTVGLKDRRPVLQGRVTVTSPAGRKRTIDGVEAALLSSQGSITPPPSAPNTLKQAAQRVERSLPATDWTDETSSVAAIFLKMSPLTGRSLGVPLDMSAVQINVRFYTTSETERNLHWLYSNLVFATMSDSPDEKLAGDYIAEINRMLKA